ncbi:DUF4625 domain-containing protein [Sediminitomix flava]|uniref:Uncharacterized protein DUF4625 n=1 Tax=Sediminitomix flava TaxID=379075 RepID=A0A315YYQ3_SEDFL|nr:DUF4625 domain-containing protein [Sediminitomix flava]PWJ35019.1 uncharacterized protein DUF4625 [Sediminitomix flava]
MNKLIYLPFLLFLFSCEEKEEHFELSIQNLEYGKGSSGHGNNQIGYAGVDLHLAANIIADHLTEEVKLTIQSLEGDEHIEYDYSEKYRGIRNPYVHEHPIIPSDFEAGSYQLDFIVKDKLGNETSDGGPLEIVSIIYFDEIELEGSIEASKEIGLSFTINGFYTLKDLIITLKDEQGEEFLAIGYDFSTISARRIEFNEHIQLPSDLPEGEYILVATARDTRNNSAKEILNK